MENDVLVVGYGPVGQVVSTLLAQRGWRVTAVERWPEPYPMPRAVGFDGETARILAAAGVASRMAEIGDCAREYTWRNANGDTLVHYDIGPEGMFGWPEATSMYQPALEAALADHGATLPSLRVLRGHEAVSLQQIDGGVELVTRSGADTHVHTAAWVIGCDGANSFVRQRMGVPVTDLGFAYDWLICDVVPHEPREFRPNNLQVCDPARPHTAVSAGRGHRRWEFMRMPGETVDELNREETAWRLLSAYGLTPANATLERHAVYTFQARWADQWRTGRLLLAGDAAHLMPPFAGQGMCSGLRDAANLTWKLDLVLRGVADEALLDTYTTERRSHVRFAINASVSLGRVICVTDPKAAADRDAAMIAARNLPKRPPRSVVQPITDGLVHNGLPSAPAPQGRVRRGDHLGLFDEVVGTGFVLLTTRPPAELLGPAHQRFLDRLGANTVHIGHDLDDVDGVYKAFLDGAVAALVRPDFYTYVIAADAAELSGALAGLEHSLMRLVGAAL